ELEREQLGAVTDAERRDALREDLRIHPRRALRIDGRRPPGQEDSDRVAPADLLDGHAVRDELRVHASLADAASDQLRVLPTEIDDQHGTFLRRGSRVQLDDLSSDGNWA